MFLGLNDLPKEPRAMPRAPRLSYKAPRPSPARLSVHEALHFGRAHVQAREGDGAGETRSTRTASWCAAKAMLKPARSSLSSLHLADLAISSLDLAGFLQALATRAHHAQADEGPALPAHARLALGQGTNLGSEAGLRDLAAQPEIGQLYRKST